MTAVKLTETLLQQGGHAAFNPAGTARSIIQTLLDEQPSIQSRLCEASVHRPTRSRVWVAAFTGPAGGQVQKSTGLMDRDQALLVAKKWEREARAQRARLVAFPRKPSIRVQPSEPSTSNSPLSQREVALLLNISERAVRMIEIRAIQKLRRHPLLRHIWQQYLSRDLEEGQPALTRQEIEALSNLVRTPEERLLILKILGLFS
jgi:hypothetical protein